jgi:hypothetical protein
MLLIAYLALLFWFDKNPPFKPLTWLILQLVFAVAITVGLIFFRLRENTGSKIQTIIYLCVWTAYTIYFLGYKEIKKYQDEELAYQFGADYNAIRHKLGVPAIPVNWWLENSNKEVAVWECKKGDTIGHTSKYISIDSTYKVVYEDDNYSFKPIKKGDHSRYLSIRSYFAKGKILKIDSIVYSYESSYDHPKNITRPQADSLFAAEMVAKDY